MRTAQLSAALHHLLAADAGDLSDRQLLTRFAAHRDEAAFAALVRRYGPLVLGVCRRVLRHEQDAEDAFQATFHVLARKAAATPWQESVGNWLYDVAFRLARKEKARADRRRQRESQPSVLPEPEAPSEPGCRELAAVVDEELHCLPDDCRSVLLLCYLEGLTRDQAARRLGWSLRTLDRRLERGRELLRTRLARRGLTMSAALLSAELARDAVVAVPPALTSAATRAATRYAAGAALGQGVLPGMAVSWSKAVLVPVVGVLAIGVAVFGYGLSGGDSPPTAEPPDAAGRTPAGREGPRAGAGEPLPAGAVARLGTTRFRHGGSIAAVAFTPDGKTFISTGEDGTACVWDAATGRELRRFTAQHPLFGIRLAVSRDAKRVAWADPGGEAVIRLHDLASGEELRQLRGHQVQIHVLAFSPDGRTLASAGGDRTVRLWDVAGGQELHRIGPLPLVGTGCQALIFSRDGKTLVAGGGRVYLWDVATAKELLKFDAPRNCLYPIALSPDGKTLASGHSGDDVKVYLWDAATGKQLRQLEGHSSYPRCVAFSPHGRVLASGDTHGTIRLWDVATGKELRQMRGHCMTVHSVAFSPDGKRLASGSMDGTVGLWDVATGKDLRPQRGHSGAVAALALSPDGRTLTSGSWDRTIRFWDAATGAEVRPMSGHQSPVSSLVFASDGKTLASAGYDGAVRLWEPATGRELRHFTGDDTVVFAMAFSPDGRVLASVGEDDTLRIREVATGKEVRQRRGGRARVSSAAFSPDGLLLAIGDHFDGTVLLRDAGTGKELHRLGAHSQQAHSIAFSPDGELLASAGDDGTIRLWDVATGHLRGLLGHEGAVMSLTFSADGKSLASAGTDKTIRFWELATGKERRRFRDDHGWPRVITLSADGKRCFSGGADSTILIWDVWAEGSRTPPRPAALTTKELEAFWADLSRADARRGFRAMRALAAARGQGIALLGGKVRPAAAIDPCHLARLVADLDSNEFSVREKATQELQALGELAAPSLRRALEKQPSLELRRRVKELLDGLNQLPAEQVRGIRAVEVLEHTGSSEARQVLRSLAQGAPEARLTREAKASLQRLAKRTAKP